jgi:hypothetical protein
MLLISSSRSCEPVHRYASCSRDGLITGTEAALNSIFGCLSPVQCRQNRDCGLQPGIDVGVRQAVGARLAENLAVVPKDGAGEGAEALR